MFNYLFSGKPDKFVVDNTNDIKQHDRDWEEIGNCKKKYLPKCGKSVSPAFKIYFSLKILLFWPVFSAAERVKSLSKKDTAPRGKKDEIKDFDQWKKSGKYKIKDFD